MTRSRGTLFMEQFGRIPSKPFDYCFDLYSLCETLGMSVKQALFLMHAKKEKLYETYPISKKNGQKRIIHAPKGMLKTIQKKIAEFLREYYKKPKCVCGFEPDTSVVVNSLPHVGKKYLINIDLSDFFNQITIKRIIGLFSKVLNLTPNVSIMLAQLATADGILPTGSPSSPIISNMIFYHADRELQAFIGKKGITYTRYADDLSFSFNDKNCLSLFFADDYNSVLQPAFENIFEKNDFPINKAKTRLQTSHMHQQVTGIKVNKKPNINSYYKHDIRLQLHSIEKHGLEVATKFYCEKTGIKYDEKNKNRLIDYLVGKMSFWKMVKGNSGLEFYRLAGKLNNIAGKRMLTIYPDKELEPIKRDCVLFAAYEENESATAFFYRGFIITCQHCIVPIKKDTKTGEAIFYNNPIEKKEIRARYVYGESQNENDFAIYKPNIVDFVELQGSKGLDNDLGDGKEVTVLGYPFYKDDLIGNTTTIKTTIITKRTDDNGKIIYVINSSVKPGLSGGPVLNQNYQVIGYMVWGSEDEKASYYNNGFMPIINIDKAIDNIQKCKASQITILPTNN